MARYSIPIRQVNGLSYPTLSARLSNRVIRFELRWMTTKGFYAVDLYEGDTPLVQGIGLHPGIDLLRNLNAGLGTIKMEGDAATPDNLGISNRLIYDDAEAE